MCPAYQSFMTAPEWKNVEISEDFADFLELKKPLYDFKFLREAYEINRIFYLTVRSSLKHNRFSEIINPKNGNYNYFTMDLFVVLMTNLSMLFSSLYCCLINILTLPYRFYSFFTKDGMKNDTDFQKVATDYYKWYVKELNIMPFFNVDYEKALGKLKADYKACKNKTWTDFWTMGYMYLEIKIKSYSYFMRPEESEPDVTAAIVKLDSDNPNIKPAWMQAVKSFQQKLTDGLKKQDEIELFKQTEEGLYEISTPRYHDFRQALEAFAENGIQIETIAGQERIQVKLVYEFKNAEDLKHAAESINSNENVSLLYQYQNIVKTNQMFFMLDCPTKNLNETLKGFEQQQFSTKFIHNF